MSSVTFLGLARKAGKVESGDEAVAILARSGKAKVIITAADAGRSTLARAENAAAAAGCPLVNTPYAKSQLGSALGRDTVGIAAITDIGFASAFVEKLSAEQGGLEDTCAYLALLNRRARQRQIEHRRHIQKMKRGK